MPVRSAGILLHRSAAARPSVAAGTPSVEVLLVHPGGPLWARQDEGAWSIPKGEHDDLEEPLAAARREFAEELGLPVPEGEAIDLGEVRLKSGKRVRAFAIDGDLDPAAIVPGTFEMVWPPRSGQVQPFPEVDRAEWFDPATARTKLNPAQAAFVDRLLDALGMPDSPISSDPPVPPET
jgi:predicted NUDIX family NTP pyrophosphohydrolase